MTFDLANLLARLELQPAGPGVYVGENLDLDYRRIFGGQILAQTIMALHATSDGKALKSLFCQFPREGDIAAPMTYSVDVHHAGRTFATLGVRATQDEKLISVSAAALHAPEEGLSHPGAPPAVPSPEDCTPLTNDMIPWEIRIVGDADLNSPGAHAPEYRFWMRAQAVTDDDDWTHQALFAHATDLTLIGTALLPVDGLSQADTGTKFHSAVTSHSLWFHQSFRLTDWVLLDQVAPVLTGARGFGHGHAWSRDGRLVASFAQESMVRLLAA